MLSASFAQANGATQFHPSGFWGQPRTIWMRRPANGEEIMATYWADGQLIVDEYRRLCWFMRDLRMEQTVDRLRATRASVPGTYHAASTISLILLDILYATSGWLVYHDLARPLHLHSGFRHPVSNAQTEGAALHSRHIKGGAGDISIPGISATNVSAFGQWLAGGGVGWYPGRHFTHVDDGRLRFWKG